MKICIFGAGAIGGHLAARLARGGAEVSVIARGQQLEAVRRNGIVVQAPDGEIRAQVVAAASAAELEPQDAVLVTVKAPALPAVAASIGPMLRPDTAVAFVMNGIPWWYFDHHGGPLDGRTLPRIDPNSTVRDAVGVGRTLGGVVYSACTVIEPGVIHVEHERNRLILGRPDGGGSSVADAIAACLSAGGMKGEVSPRIRDRIWEKLLLNLATGPMAVLTGLDPATMFADETALETSRRVIGEVMGIAQAMGCTIGVDPEKLAAQNRGLRHKPSILQDLELQRPMEVEAIFAAPLELAGLAGAPAPTLALLVTLAKMRARAAGLYSP